VTVEFDLDFTGVERVMDRITRVSEDLKPAVHLVMESNVDKMYRLARDLVRVRTGFLRQSIYWRPTDLMRFVFGAYAPYARYVEYGTSRMAARPFLRPAMSMVWPDMTREIALKIRELMERS